MVKECGTIEKYFSTVMMCNFKYPCFHCISVVQLTASRVKATVAKGSLQPTVGGSRDLSLLAFPASHMKSKGLLKTTHTVNVSLTPYPHCEFN